MRKTAYFSYDKLPFPSSGHGYCHFRSCGRGEQTKSTIIMKNPQATPLIIQAMNLQDNNKNEFKN